MSKLILFPNVGRIEPFDSFKNARTIVQVTHRLELTAPQSSDDYFRLIDHIGAEVQILATLRSGKEEVEAIVRRFPIEVPPTTSVFLDSEFFSSLGSKLQKKMKTRAWTVSNYMERQERAAQYAQDEPDLPSHSHQPNFGSSPLSLPQPGMMPSQHSMQRSRYEITPQDTMRYESAMNRIQSFMNKYNAKNTAPVEYKLNQFFTMLADSHPGSREMAETIRRIEKSIATEIASSIQLVG